MAIAQRHGAESMDWLQCTKASIDALLARKKVSTAPDFTFRVSTETRHQNIPARDTASIPPCRTDATPAQHARSRRYHQHEAGNEPYHHGPEALSRAFGAADSNPLLASSGVLQSDAVLGGSDQRGD
jgi:hypothetical protein